ncbi:MAG: Trk system potassium transport protein TrkA [Candidatus Cloacimonetes bacterium 4572_55]|nr:MAG: Trk system potassium transport protein TrkA [Candidatus Cloacimonetes bacterium 4572_55]
MNTIIIGAGVVGFYITQLLSMEKHNVTVIDIDQEALRRIEETYDVQTLQGHGASTVILVEADIDEADLVVAVTSNDEINILACLIGKQLGAKRTIVRLENPAYHDVSDRFLYRDLLGIDLVINPKNLAAMEIYQRIRMPGAVAVESFAGGRVTMKQLHVTPSFKHIGQELKDYRLPIKCVVAAVLREDQVIIPSGIDVLQADDMVFVVGEKDKMKKIETFFGKSVPDIRNVTIVGGGDIGITVAKNFEAATNISVKLFDEDHKRCEELSRELNRTLVIYGSGTDLTLLKEERVFNTDAFIAVSGEDETNLLAGLLAKELGVPKSIVLVDRPDYMPVYERLGIDSAISPRILTAKYVLKYVHPGNVSAVSFIKEDKAEILEILVGKNSQMDGITLKDAPKAEFPRGAVIGAVVKSGKVVIPFGDTVMNEGDTVIIFALPQVVRQVEDAFKKAN